MKQPAVQDVSPFGFRHRTARDAVVASQRGRMLEAMVKTVAQKGYGETTLAHVVAKAGVSRRTFYEQFRDKEECFLAAFDTGVRFLFARIQEESEHLPPDDWRGRMRVLIETYFSTLASEPEFARVLHVDVLAAGDRGRARWADLLQRLVAYHRSLHASARAEDPRIPAVGDDVLLVLLGGIPEVVREYVRSGRLQRLPDIAPQLTALAISVVSGAGQTHSSASRTRASRRS